MRRFFPTILLAALTYFLFPLDSAMAQHPHLRLHRPLGEQFRSQQRQIHRPNVHVIRTKGASRTLSAGSAVTVLYSVVQGYVSRIEIRSGLKVIRTLPLTPSRSGQIQISVPSGLKRFTLWAWQGKPGYQSVHGESIGYSIAP